MSNRNPGRRKANKTNAILVYIIIILIMSSIAVIGIFLNIGATRGSGSERVETNIVRGEIMRTDLRDANGDYHTLDARFAVDMGEEYDDNNLAAMFAEINRSLTTLDYDKLSDYDSMEYVKGHIMDNLNASGRVNTENIAGIYVTDFITDSTITADTLPKNNRATRVFNNLFQNSN